MRPLDIASLRQAYDGGLDPADLLRDIFAAIAASGERPVWISLTPQSLLDEKLASLRRRRSAGEPMPLYGLPFAVKDNIDVAGLPTTAACPAFAYTPARSATVVERLEAAGAIVVGKTNLDQFATGLVGTRSPYGIPSSVFDARYISGGSSSGSAVAVAGGLVSFALGTDTAGSGRVPASFNNIVGLKPTKGWLSTRGVVPACRSLDCVSIFAATATDALAVADIAGGFDNEDPFSRRAPTPATTGSGGFRFGVPRHLEFFGDSEAQRLYEQAARRMEEIGGTPVAVDDEPLREAARLLYTGPWLAERLVAVDDFMASHANEMDATVRGIIEGARDMSASHAFRGLYRLAELMRAAEPIWKAADVLLLPTAPTTYRIDELLADPVRLNANLGIYTNFVNLMDLSALAVPAGFRAAGGPRAGLPFGVSLIGRAFQDADLAAIGDRLHRAGMPSQIGATGHPLPAAAPVAVAGEAGFDIAVVGAHLAGLPLNHQLTERGGKLARKARTAPGYSLYALPNTTPPKPALVRDGQGRGDIEIEIWTLPPAAVGSFMALVPAPLAIGTIALADGSAVKGFLCEAHAVAQAEDITRFGGWRAYLAALPAKTAV